jgi:hypothetical protein
MFLTRYSDHLISVFAKHSLTQDSIENTITSIAQTTPSAFWLKQSGRQLKTQGQESFQPTTFYVLRQQPCFYYVYY